MKTKQLNKLLLVGRALSKATGSERLEWQTIQTFLIICLQGGECPMAEIEKQLGMGQSTVSRNVAKLGPGVTPDDPGAKLVEAHEDPYYRRRKLVRLTEKGKRLCGELGDIVEG